ALKSGITTGVTTGPIEEIGQTSTFGEDGGGPSITVENLASFGAPGTVVAKEGDSGGFVGTATGQSVAFLGSVVGGPQTGETCFFSTAKSILQALQAQGVTAEPMLLQATAPTASAAGQQAPATTVTQSMPPSVGSVTPSNMTPIQTPTLTPSTPTTGATTPQTPAPLPGAPATTPATAPAAATPQIPRLGPGAPTAGSAAPPGRRI
ncbi:MAG: hypothetical protein ACREP9_21940, partial [Candidatus Dormibacteraceae bacterium]